MEEEGRIYGQDETEPEFTDESVPEVSDRKALAGSLIAVMALIVFHAWQLLDWNRLEGRPPAWDQSIHLEIAQDYKRAIAKGDLKDLLFLKPKPGMPPFPPLYHLSLQPALDAADPASAARLPNILYMAILCLSVWGVGRRFAGEWGGLGAAVLMSCIPEVQWLFREQLVDLALIAWVAAAYWALIESREFERFVPSALCGLLFGAAMMTKWSAFSYFLPALGAAVLAARQPGRSRNIAVCGLFSIAACLPWYLAQWPVVLPRLVEASKDQAVPVWKGGAAFTYLWQMFNGLELPFCLIGLVSLAVPSARRGRGGGTLLVLWFLSSLVFWTLVPNRQLRYLLPGIVPLAVLAMGPWPKKMLAALCAFQLFGAFNYPRALVPPVNIDLIAPVVLFRSQRPAKEDWKTREILQAAASLHDPQSTSGNITFLANHPQFNGSIFDWELSRLAPFPVAMRGVNRRVCELSEFLLLKTESLGPACVVNQLPKVRDEILIPGSWFLRGYQQARTWDLPDKSQAVLYQRRRPKEPPFPEKRARYDYYENDHLTAEGLSLEFGPWDAERGVYPKAVIRASAATFRGLRIDDLALELYDLLMVPVETPDPKTPKYRQDLLLDVRLLRLSRLKVLSASVSEDSAAAFMKARAPKLQSAKFTLDKTVSLEVKARNIPIFAEAFAELAADKKSLTLGLKRLAVRGIPFPMGLLGPHRRYVLDFAPDEELPFEIEMGGLTIAGGRLVIRS
ncbi:MAG: glycosyltransferase family 39 protein [Elusimicrobiota bacterium]